MTQGAHYETALNDIIEHIKADKGITQPWRNYCIKHLMEAQAHIRMGCTSTNRTELPGANGEVRDHYSLVNTGPATSCNCPTGGKRRDCPVHGEKAA